jgi:hypothetical protein
MHQIRIAEVLRPWNSSEMIDKIFDIDIDMNKWDLARSVMQ